MTPLDHAKEGDVDYFKTVELYILQNYRDETNDPILSVTAIENQLECCKVIYDRCPEQLFCQNTYGNTILHHVSHYGGGMARMLEFFFDVGIKAGASDIESGQPGGENRFQKWCRLQNYEGNKTALIRGLHNRNLETTKLWLQVDHDYELGLLKIADSDKNTPLHLAVGYQDFELVKLLISSRRSDFEYGPNNNSETPLMIAGREAQSSAADNTPAKIRKLLLEMQPYQSTVRTGDKGWTVLHHATRNGDLGTVADIIQVCPECMELVDNEGRNFLHLAAKFEQVNIVKHIFEMKEISAREYGSTLLQETWGTVLNGKDNYGNTPLHIASETANKNMVEYFLYDPIVDKMTTNAKGQKVLEAITFDYDKEKAGVYGVRDRMNEKELKDQSDFDLVVGALIATVSFTAGITVPGGYISDGPNSGLAVLSKSTSFEAFVISNNFALVFSLYAVFSHFCTRRLLRREDIIYQLNVATFCTLSAIFAMMVAFITGSYAVLCISNRVAITVCVNSCCFFIFAFRALWRMVMQNKHAAPWNFNGFS
ncbi:Ankyrin repeat family protein [Thalictrum thalictroides]|uniref:Ankyrin repeat family protein n=1 Tax=Thalictrum thalictroides TaxID=46969 RepID=A0A7J6UT61_THATH|nr:Ankyrin repeat family protein [Thalictrum thalictroides]